MNLFRINLLGAVLLFSGLGMNQVVRQPAVPPSRPLAAFPLHLGRWQGSSIALGSDVLQALQLHDYLNRVYVTPDGSSVGLYIAYYPRQRFGDDIHSPKHCLPGAGWEVLTSRVVPVALPGRQLLVNQYQVRRGSDQALILYWYQQQGRVIASEYWSKFYQVWDGLTRRRSDAALVRVAIPMNTGSRPAEALGVRFIRRIFPALRVYIPR